MYLTRFLFLGNCINNWVGVFLCMIDMSMEGIELFTSHKQIEYEL